MFNFFTKMSEHELLKYYEQFSIKELMLIAPTTRLRKIALTALFKKDTAEAQQYQQELLKLWVHSPSEFMPNDNVLLNAITRLPLAVTPLALKVIINRKRKQIKDTTHLNGLPNALLQLLIRDLQYQDNDPYHLSHPNAIALMRLRDLAPLLSAKECVLIFKPVIESLKYQNTDAFKLLPVLIPHLTEGQLELLFDKVIMSYGFFLADRTQPSYSKDQMYKIIRNIMRQIALRATEAEHFLYYLHSENTFPELDFLIHALHYFYPLMTAEQQKNHLVLLIHTRKKDKREQLDFEAIISRRTPIEKAALFNKHIKRLLWDENDTVRCQAILALRNMVSFLTVEQNDRVIGSLMEHLASQEGIVNYFKAMLWDPTAMRSTAITVLEIMVPYMSSNERSLANQLIQTDLKPENLLQRPDALKAFNELVPHLKSAELELAIKPIFMNLRHEQTTEASLDLTWQTIQILIHRLSQEHLQEMIPLLLANIEPSSNWNVEKHLIKTVNILRQHMSAPQLVLFLEQVTQNLQNNNYSQYQIKILLQALSFALTSEQCSTILASIMIDTNDTELVKKHLIIIEFLVPRMTSAQLAIITNFLFIERTNKTYPIELTVPTFIIMAPFLSPKQVKQIYTQFNYKLFSDLTFSELTDHVYHLAPYMPAEQRSVAFTTLINSDIPTNAKITIRTRNAELFERALETVTSYMDTEQQILFFPVLVKNLTHTDQAIIESIKGLLLSTFSNQLNTQLRMSLFSSVVHSAHSPFQSYLLNLLSMAYPSFDGESNEHLKQIEEYQSYIFALLQCINDSNSVNIARLPCLSSVLTHWMISLLNNSSEHALKHLSSIIQNINELQQETNTYPFMITKLVSDSCQIYLNMLDELQELTQVKHEPFSACR